MAEKQNLHDLFVDGLKDLYNAEKQLVKALPKMVDKATSAELSDALTNHLEQTQLQVERLEEVFGLIGENSGNKRCKGMEGLIEEGKEVLEEDGDGAVIDAGIIAAAQKVEHYEIAAYGTAVAHAQALGLTEAEALLQETLDEEKEADRLLSSIAETAINELAAMGEEEDEGASELLEAMEEEASGPADRAPTKKSPSNRSRSTKRGEGEARA